jgi:putative membrane protein
MSYLLQHWTGAWPVLAVWAIVAALHLAALRRPRVRYRAREAAAFDGGMLLVLLALVSPLGYWAGRYIWVRSIQDLLLAFAAPALIVLGAPWMVWARGRPAERAGRRWRPAWPVAVVLAFNVIWLGWHVTAAYDLAATNPAVRYLEYVSYLAAGIGFWLQLIGSRPALPPMRRLALLVGTAAADTVLGMVLVFGSAVVYPAYRGAGHHALSVLSDQQVAGAVLWMGVLPALIIAALALINGWLDAEESDELSRDLERVLGRAPVTPQPLKAVWHARSGYRRPTI